MSSFTLCSSSPLVLGRTFGKSISRTTNRHVRPVHFHRCRCFLRGDQQHCRLQERIRITKGKSVGVDQARAASECEVTTQPGRQQVWTVPTILTACRILAVPLLTAVWFSQLQNAPQICCGIFLAASFTDFLDGYLARKWALTSNFGAFLDPVADKLMVAAVLILMSSRPLAIGPLAGNSWVLPVISSVIIGREIAMSALRELAASLGGEAYSAVAVSSWGKWKTATQMSSLTLMLFSAGESSAPLYSTAARLGLGLLFCATILTVVSLADYLKGLWKYL